jgi:hypothetical protein
MKSWRQAAEKGFLAITEAWQGKPEESCLAAVIAEEFHPPDLSTQSQFLVLGLNPPAAEEQGIFQIWSEMADADKGITDAPKTKATVKKSSAKNRSAYKKLAPYKPPVAAFDPSMMAAMQSNSSAAPKAAPKAMAASAAPEAAPAASAVAVSREPGAKITLAAGMDPKIISDKIVNIAKSIIGDDEDIEVDTPLMQAGITSNTAVILRDTVSTELVGVNLPPTLMFDYPSVEAITGFIMDKLG